MITFYYDELPISEEIYKTIIEATKEIFVWRNTNEDHIRQNIRDEFNS
jgi:hypothetical protein